MPLFAAPRYEPARITILATIAALSLVLAGCGASKDAKKDKGPPEVGYAVMHAVTVPLLIDLPGRISPARSSEVRPQISGVIQRRLFTEGAFVRVGQPLYQIDASVYRAAADQARANLASAQAAAAAASAKAARYKPLADAQAVAAQDYTDALAASRQARAAIAQNQAALNSAQINLRFTTVPAPITGRIGRSLFTEGALVTLNQTDPLAVISVLDPIFVDLQQSSGDMLRLRRQLASGGVLPMTAQVRLKLDDGSDYDLVGTVEFSEVTADPQTGTVTLRARFANPQGLLMPGMFVRASFAQASVTGAFLVPQTAVTRDPKGNATVFVVGKDGKAVSRPVAADRTYGDAWVITGGLREGERVITQGVGKVRPGQSVKAVPENSPQDGGKGPGQGGAQGQGTAGKAG